MKFRGPKLTDPGGIISWRASLQLRQRGTSVLCFWRCYQHDKFIIILIPLDNILFGFSFT